MCKICNSPDRADIENAILSISMENGPTIDSIADQYQLDVNELRAHALWHTPLVAPEEITVAAAYNDQPVVEGKTSLVRRMKLREADVLNAVNNEYMVTLKALGRRINRLAARSDIDVEDQEKEVKLAKLLTKPMVDAYIGLGGEIRQNVKAMAEIDRLLNGPQDSTAGGLQALADAIKGSGSSG